jgi:hypothetical protein
MVKRCCGVPIPEEYQVTHQIRQSPAAFEWSWKLDASMDGYAPRQSNRATLLPGFGNRTNTSGSWPGMINRRLAASFLIR